MMARPQSDLSGAQTDHSPRDHLGSDTAQVARCNVAPHSRPPAEPSSITSLFNLKYHYVLTGSVTFFCTETCT